MIEPAKSIDVGIVVVTYQSHDVIGGLLDSLELGLGDLSWQFVVVDNGSTDGTTELVRARGFDVIEMEANPGYAAAINAGARRFTDVRSTLVLNPDVALRPSSVPAMFTVLHDDSRVGIVAPKMLIPGEPLKLEPSQRREPSLLSNWATALLGAKVASRIPGWYEAVVDPGRYESACDVDWAVGAVLLIGRRCAEAVGDWDETYFLYSEETDYCRRARYAGFAVRYTPAAVVEHRGGDGLVNPRLRAMMSINRVREYRRRHGELASWCFYAGCVLHEASRGIVGRGAARAAAVALISPSRRPPEIKASASFLPQ